MTTFRALVCDVSGSEARQAAYRVVHDDFCAEIFREVAQRLDWPPPSASALLAAEPAQQGEHLRAFLDDIPTAWRRARVQLCELGGNHPQICLHAGHLVWVLIATVFEKISPQVLQVALRELPDARLAMLYAYGTSHLRMFQYVARHDLHRRLANARSAAQEVTREIQESGELGLMPDAGMFRELAISLRRQAALHQVLEGGAAATVAASAAEVISASMIGTGLTRDLQVVLDVLLLLAGRGEDELPQDEADAGVLSLLTFADAKLMAHAPACCRAALAIQQFVDFARNWNTPVFFDGDGQPLRLLRVQAVRAALVDDGNGNTMPQIQLVSSISVRGRHCPVTLIAVVRLDEDGTLIGLADYAQLRGAWPVSDTGKFSAQV